MEISIDKTPLSVAISQMGVRENPKGSNKGVEVSMYLQSVGIDFPAPWCMAFVYWCCTQAGIKGLIKTGGVLRQWHEIDPLAKKKTPKVGDIFIMDFGGGKGHTGFIKTVNDTTRTFTTIEGNSDANGSRTGGMVCSNQRKFSSCVGFIRV